MFRKVLKYTLTVKVEGASSPSNMEMEEAKKLFEKQLRNRVINAGSTHLRVIDLNEETRK